MKIKAVIFDLFGTLIANYDREHYLAVAEKMGEAAGAEPVEFRTIWRKYYVERLTGVFKTESENIRWVCEQLGHVASPEQVESANQVYLEFAMPFLATPRESSIELLEGLKARGVRTGLLSDCGPWVPNHWDSSPFSKLIDFPVYSSKSGKKKPDESLYRNAANGLGVQPEEAMYVADGNGEELVVACRLGMRAVRITPWNAPGSTPDADYSHSWEHESVDALWEILELLND
jgi:putative hydrolase of the HAD superfamily